MIPPVFHSGNRKWPPLARVCLITSALVHIAFSAFILTRFYWIPSGLALLALPFLAFGMVSLWGFPRFLGVLSVCYALAAAILLAIGVLILGERNGADLIASGLATPLLVNAILLGYARKRIRRAPFPHPEGPEPLTDAMVWTAGAVLLGFGLWILSSNAGESSTAKTAGTKSRSRTEPPTIPTGMVPPESLQRNLETPPGHPGLSRYQQAFLDAVLRQSGLAATADSARSGPLPAKRYLAAAYYASEGDVYEDTTKPSSLSCRTALLRGLLPQALSAWPKESYFQFSGPMQGDSRFHSFDCSEFPDSLHYYDLDDWSRPDSASWRPVTPSYHVKIEVRRYWLDSTRWAKGTLSPDSMLEKASVSFVVRPAETSYLDWSGLILQSATRVDTTPFAYSRFAGPGSAKPVWDPALKRLGFRSEIPDIGANAFKSLIWTQQFGIPARNASDSENFTLHRAALNALTRDGGNVTLAEWETRICRGDLPFRWSKSGIPVLGPDVMDPSPLILSDLDRDGEPEILIDSRVLGMRWIFLGKDGTRFDAVIRPPAKLPPCC